MNRNNIYCNENEELRIGEVKRLVAEEPKKYYIYELLRSDGRPFYVGKGSGVRLQWHEQEALNTNGNHLKLKIIRGFLRKFGFVLYRIAGFYSNEEHAYNVEKFLIKYHGRIDLGTGILTNLTDGGDPRNVSEQSKLLLSKSIKKWVKEHPEEHEAGQEKATEGKRKSENRERSRQTQLKYMDEHPEEFQETMNKTHETRRRPENRKANREKLKHYYRKPGSKERSSQISSKWVEDNPEEHQEIMELANQGKRTPEARAKNSESRLKNIKENPEKERQRLEKMRRTCRTLENREKNRQAQTKQLAEKKIIVDRCINLIKNYNLNLKIPDGRKSPAFWMKFEYVLLSIT